MICVRQILTGMVATMLCIAANGFTAAASNAQNAAQEQKVPAVPNGKLIASYHGVLPCADCPGIDTTVKLFTTEAQAAHGRYLIKRVYQERKSSYTEAGTWTLEKGTPDDPSASVYLLKPKTGTGVTNFLRVGDDEIKQLDSDRKPFTGTVNFSLKRIVN
jgi:copper homeostasis protein (lipoprotein)